MLFEWAFPYPSQRMPVLARNVVATSQPLAAQAGLSALQQGGNAVDASLAAAICLTVVEPTSNGIGGDAFAIVWDGSDLLGLNGSGRSPASWSPERFRDLERMPDRGWDSVTVPGAVAAWADLSEKAGALPFTDLFAPAVRYAREGFPVSPLTARAWARAADLFKDFPAFAGTFLPGGRPPEAGETFRCPELADTLEEIAETRGDSFYRGRLSRAIVKEARRGGAALSDEDLAGHASTWVHPLSMQYGDADLHELPPNGQGLSALVALGILDRLDLSGCAPDSPDAIHLQIEAMKTGLETAYRHVADPEHMTVPPEAFLEESFLDRKAAEIRRDRARRVGGPVRKGGGTVYLAAADEAGRMVSFIQSNFYGFGSGVVIPGTGISLQSRGLGFTLEAGHPNRVGGGKRPFHTIMPGFVTRQGGPVMSFGVMGGNMQAQGHLQMMARIFAYGQNPQAASDAPRWYLFEDFRLALEPGFEPATAVSLAARGHAIAGDDAGARFGGAQLIHKVEGGWLAASDSRKDGQAVGY